jgi:hypothetical protein
MRCHTHRCNGGCLRRVAESNKKNWNIIYLLRDLHIYRTKDIIDNMMLTNDHPRLEQNVINFYRYNLVVSLCK